MENNKSTVALDANTMSTLVNMMRTMVRQELSSNKPSPPQQANQSKPKVNVSNAVSIRDEIRRIVREEIQTQKNNSNQSKPAVQQNKPVQSQNKPVQNQNKASTPQNQPKQNSQVPQTLRITSVEQLAAHLQKSINEQLQKRQQMMGKPAQLNPVQIKVVQSSKDNLARPQNKPAQVPPKSPQQVQVRPIQNQNKLMQQPKTAQKQFVQIKTMVTNSKVQVQNKPVDLKVGLNPGNKRGQSTNNPVLQQQANDLLAKIANAKKQQAQQNNSNQQKK